MRGQGRARTVPKHALQRALMQGRTDPECSEEGLPPRPVLRAQCEDGVRPCPWVGCRYNMFLEVRPNGNIRFRTGSEDPTSMDPRFSCVLDVADRVDEGDDEAVYRELGEALGVHRSRVHQMVRDAAEAFRGALGTISW
jgi:hypothetical protein